VRPLPSLLPADHVPSAAVPPAVPPSLSPSSLDSPSTRTPAKNGRRNHLPRPPHRHRRRFRWLRQRSEGGEPSRSEDGDFVGDFVLLVDVRSFSSLDSGRNVLTRSATNRWAITYLAQLHPLISAFSSFFSSAAFSAPLLRLFPPRDGMYPVRDLNVLTSPSPLKQSPSAPTSDRSRTTLTASKRLHQSHSSLPSKAAEAE